jgi:hypothetical protein
LIGIVLPNFRDCLNRGRTFFSTMFFLGFESETAGVRRVAGGLLLDKVAPGSYIRSMRMATRFRPSAAGRTKQEQFGAMQGHKIARRMTPIPGTASRSCDRTPLPGDQFKS